MQNVLHWQKRIFQCNFQITANDERIGYLRNSEFSKTATGQLHDTEISFRSHESLHSSADILDPLNSQKVGDIRFNPWYPKATIRYGEEIFYWKFANIWETRWKVYDESGVQIAYRGWSGKGKVLVNKPEEWLILAGLFISSYYWRMSAIWVACFMPIALFYVFWGFK